MTRDITCVRANNPSPMTYTGTNSYLVGVDRLMLIDPGPALPAHRDALLQAIGGRDVSHIIVTHSHLDHSPLAASLSADLDAPVVAFGPSTAGRSPIMAKLAASGLVGGGEGVDPDFTPDLCVADGDLIDNGALELRVLHTPGHMGNHISLEHERAVFSGDLVMGWASSLVSPPDGDLTDFMESCARLQTLAPDVLYPGHGDAVTDPAARINWLIDHRNSRSDQIIKALSVGPMTVEALTKTIYTDTPPALHPAAARNVLAHLVHLTQLGHVAPEGPLRAKAMFRRKTKAEI